MNVNNVLIIDVEKIFFSKKTSASHVSLTDYKIIVNVK